MHRYRHRQLRPRHPARRVVFGLAVIGIGTLALLDRLDIFSQALLSTYWPLALVLVGLSRFIWARHPSGGLFNIGLIAAGSLMTASNLGLMHLRPDDWWPVLIIVFGLSMLLRGVFPKRDLGQEPASTNSTLEHKDRIDVDATFSALDLRNDSPNFKGGRIDATFGGVELDLSQATMEGTEATLEIVARFGGVQLRVPRAWQVVVDIGATFGGVEDRTAPPMNPTQRLLLRGEALFGGIEIRN